MRPMCALYVLERLLHVVTHGRLVNFLAAALLRGAPLPAAAPAAGARRADGGAASGGSGGSGGGKGGSGGSVGGGDGSGMALARAHPRCNTLELSGAVNSVDELDAVLAFKIPAPYVLGPSHSCHKACGPSSTTRNGLQARAAQLNVHQYRQCSWRRA